MKSIRFYLLGILVVVIISCSTKPLIPERPVTITTRKAVVKEISYLNIPVEIKAEELAKILDQMIPVDLYKGATMTAGLSVTIKRKGAITVTASDDFINFRVPTVVTGNYFLVSSPEIPLNLSFKTKISITSDWRYNAETHFTGLYNLVYEEIGIGPLSLKPRSLVENALSPIQRMISNMVNNKLNDKISLKAQVEKAWQNVFNPISIDKNMSAWLKITPQEVMIFPIKAQNNLIQFSMGFKTYADVIVGPKPETGKIIPLPNLKIVNTFDKSFTLNIFADLYYADMVKIATNTIINKDLDAGGHKIKIVGLDIYGNGENLVIKTELKGDVEGIIYLTGKPKFDKVLNMFSIEELEFDMMTKSMLLGTADWLLHGAIRNIIQEKLRIDLTQKLEEARLIATKAMEKQKIIDRVFIKGTIKSLKINDLYVGDDRISIQIFTDGETGIIFQ